MMSTHLLWYRQPARSWDEALPIGNGRIGAMCFGTPLDERLQLNDDRAWSGSPASEATDGLVSAETAAAARAAALTALDAGDQAAAEAAMQRLQQRYTQAFQPFADLHVRVRDGSGAVAEYRRELDLRTAVHRTRYLRDGHAFTQDTYVSHPAGVLVTEVRSAAPVDLELRLTSPHIALGRAHAADGISLLTRLPSDVAPGHEPDLPAALWDDAPGRALRAATVVGVVADGAVVTGETIVLRGVTGATVVVGTATTFAGYGQPLLDEVPLAATWERVRAALRRPDELRAEHIADHATLYGRTELAFGGGDEPDAAAPTDERLRAAIARSAQGRLDAGMTALLFHFGRYLLIASSRPGTTATNLQGLWNDQLQPPWSGNHTININTQMNYWGAEVANLRELHAPLFDFVTALAAAGEATARRLYGARGWVAHHNSDQWCFTSPVGRGRGDLAWAWWPMAGPWLAAHFGAHLDFGFDEAFARERAWPVISSCARFLLDWLAEDGDGQLGTALSTSPENAFVLPDGSRGALGRSATMDLSLVRETLTRVVALDARLGLDAALARECADALVRLRRPGIGADGRVLEWAEGRPDAEVHHRHVSHLYGLFPGHEGWDDALRAAATGSLDTRGNDASGWSLAWKIALRARLGQADVVEALLRLFFRTPDPTKHDSGGSLLPNLLQTSPPFQIDANLGLVGALSEALLQSHDGAICLLPALPAALGTGSARGLVARPGVVVDMAWESGRLTALTLTARADAEVTVRWPDGDARVSLHPDEPARIVG